MSCILAAPFKASLVKELVLLLICGGVPLLHVTFRVAIEINPILLNHLSADVLDKLHVSLAARPLIETLGLVCILAARVLSRLDHAT